MAGFLANLYTYVMSIVRILLVSLLTLWAIFIIALAVDSTLDSHGICRGGYIDTPLSCSNTALYPYVSFIRAITILGMILLPFIITPVTLLLVGLVFLTRLIIYKRTHKQASIQNTSKQ